VEVIVLALATGGGPGGPPRECGVEEGLSRACRREEALEVARRAGVEARLEMPGLSMEGDAWWGPGVDAWPLGSLIDWGPVPVAYPGSPGEVERLVEEAARMGACLAARGGGSGVLGAVRSRCCLIVDLSRLDWVAVSPERMVVEAGAGASLWRVEEEAGRYGLTTGLEPQSIRVASVGGLVATLGSGALTPGVGNVEDVLVWVEAVVPGLGRVRLGGPGAPRGFQPLAGPQHLLGQEGGLAVITGVGLRLRKAPRYRSGATFRLPGVPEALEAARRLVQWSPPALLRVLDEQEAGVMYGVYETLLLVEYVDDEGPRVPEALLGKAESVVAQLGGSRTRDVIEEWRRNRYDYMGWVRRLYEAGLWFDTIDTQAPWPVLPSLHKDLHQALAGVPGVMAVFSHISHFYTNGGSLYTTIIVERDPQALARAWRAAMQAVMRHEASVTHHHGVGLQKLYWYAKQWPDSLRVYCRLKQALDPEGTLWAPAWPACRCLESEPSEREDR